MRDEVEAGKRVRLGPQEPSDPVEQGPGGITVRSWVPAGPWDQGLGTWIVMGLAPLRSAHQRVEGGKFSQEVPRLESRTPGERVAAG